MKASACKNVTGAKIREARTFLAPGLTQHQLAQRVTKRGVVLDQGAISRIENGSRHVLDTELVAIAKSLEVPVGLLFGETRKEVALGPGVQCSAGK